MSDKTRRQVCRFILTANVTVIKAICRDPQDRTSSRLKVVIVDTDTFIVNVASVNVPRTLLGDIRPFSCFSSNYLDLWMRKLNTAQTGDAVSVPCLTWWVRGGTEVQMCMGCSKDVLLSFCPRKMKRLKEDTSNVTKHAPLTDAAASKLCKQNSQRYALHWRTNTFLLGRR